MIGRVLMNHNVCDESNLFQKKEMNISKPVGAHHGDKDPALFSGCNRT